MSSIAETKKRNKEDHVAELFMGQDYEETTTTRRRLKDKRKAEVRALYEASLPQREASDPARVVMKNEYKQQYDEGVTKPLMNSLLGGKYYESKEHVGELGRPHGMSARMAGTKASPPRPSTAQRQGLVNHGVQASPEESLCDQDGEDVSAEETTHYQVQEQPAKRPQVPPMNPFPQDDSHDYFGKKLKPKPVKEDVPKYKQVFARSVGVEADEDDLPKPRLPKKYDYSAPKHPAAPIRSVQTNTDISGHRGWNEASHKLPKMGGYLDPKLVEIDPSAIPSSGRRPDTANSRTSRHGSRPLDTCKFLF